MLALCCVQGHREIDFESLLVKGELSQKVYTIMYGQVFSRTLL